MKNSILIIDFGSQVTQLIARRVREAGVYSEIVPFNTAAEKLESFEPSGIILSGGPASAIGDETFKAPDKVFTMGVPVLGICYGQQTMTAQLGGRVEEHEHKEFGRAQLDIIKDCSLFDDFWKAGTSDQVWMSHGDTVTQIPPGFETVGISKGAPYAAIANEEKKFYGVQFHPEVVHTPKGHLLISNMVDIEIQ